MKVTKVPVVTEKYILELSREEAMVLKVLCGITTGDHIKSYRRVASALWEELKDLEWSEKNYMTNDLLTCYNDNCGNKIHWKDGFISNSEFEDE